MPGDAKRKAAADTIFRNSLWSATAVAKPDTPPLKGEARADVAIIGGGYTGLSTALHLAEAGADVAVLEAVEPGWGASGRNGGQVVPGLRMEFEELVAQFGADRGARLFSFAGEAAQFTFDLIAAHGIECYATQSGWITPAHSTAAMGPVERRASHWQALGAPVEVIGKAEMARLLGTSFYHGGYRDGRGGSLQPLSYARGLARVAMAKGARIYGRSPATRLHSMKRKWRIETPDGALIAGQALIATNAYGGIPAHTHLWPKLDRSAVPATSFQVATKPLSANLAKSILPGGEAASDTRRILSYFRKSPDGRFIMGGRGGLWPGGGRQDYAPVMQRIHSIFPQLDSMEPEYFWNGRVAITLDHVPHIHELAPGLYAGLGFNGRGVALATAVGPLLAKLVQGWDEGDGPFQVTRLKAVPFHGAHVPATQVAVLWQSLLDNLELRRG